MRARPSPTIALAIMAAYLGLLAVSIPLSGVDYDTIANSTGNLIRAAVVPIGIGAVMLALIARRLGWWAAAMRERATAGPRWLLIVPTLMALIAVINLTDNGLRGESLGFVLVALIGVCLVGFSEELLTRGLMLVGFRGSMREVGVWFFTSLLFGVLHAINILAGQAVDTTLQQIVFAFAFGSVLYLTRRVTGTLIACMALHAFWDFATLMGGSGSAATSTKAPGGPGSLLILPLLLVTAYGLVRVLRRGQPTGDPINTAGSPQAGGRP